MVCIHYQKTSTITVIYSTYGPNLVLVRVFHLFLFLLLICFSILHYRWKKNRQLYYRKTDNYTMHIEPPTFFSLVLGVSSDYFGKSTNFSTFTCREGRRCTLWKDVQRRFPPSSLFFTFFPTRSKTRWSKKSVEKSAKNLPNYTIFADFFHYHKTLVLKRWQSLQRVSSRTPSKSELLVFAPKHTLPCLPTYPPSCEYTCSPLTPPPPPPPLPQQNLPQISSGKTSPPWTIRSSDVLPPSTTICAVLVFLKTKPSLRSFSWMPPLLKIR